MYFIGSKCRFTSVKSLLKLILCGTVLGFVIESGSVFVHPSRVAHASQTKVFLSHSRLPVSVDGLTVKRFHIDKVIVLDEVKLIPVGASSYLRFLPQAIVSFDVVNEQLEPVEVKYRIQVTDPVTGEVLGEKSIQDTLAGYGKYIVIGHKSHRNAELDDTGFMSKGYKSYLSTYVYLDKTKHQLPDKLSFTVTIETNRSPIAYVLKAPEYIVGEELKQQYYSARITESTTSTQLIGCFRPSDVNVPKVVSPKENERSHVQVPKVVLHVPKVVRPRKNEGPQRRAVSPRQILLVPVQKLSPIVPQKKLMPIKLQKETRKTNVSAN